VARGVTLVAIHQPNFLPWLGYFDKIRRADVFIVLDDVQFQKSGATWSNRVQLLIAGTPAWVTVPIVRAYHGTRTVSEMEINDRSPWRDKLLRTIELNYHRAPQFDGVYPGLATLVGLQTKSLLEYNVHAIRSIITGLGLDPGKMIMGSELSVHTTSTDRLIGLVRAVGGDSYLVGGGAQGYQDDRLFDEAGINLVRQAFQHPTYRQPSAPQFVPGLSIVDALMNCGFEGTADLLQRGQSA
jgi:hypothetical protein